MLSAVSRKVRLSSLARSKSASEDVESPEEDGEAFTDAAEVSTSYAPPSASHLIATLVAPVKWQSHTPT